MRNGNMIRKTKRWKKEYIKYVKGKHGIYDDINEKKVINISFDSTKVLPQILVTKIQLLTVDMKNMNENITIIQCMISFHTVISLYGR